MEIRKLLGVRSGYTEAVRSGDTDADKSEE